MAGRPKRREREGLDPHPERAKNPASGVPARGYSWAPFEPGNEAGLVHGAQSERKLAPIAKRLAGELELVAPWCARPAFEPSVKAWAWGEAECELYRQHFGQRETLVDDNDEPALGLARWGQAEARAQRLRATLGLDPQSLAKLLNGLALVAYAAGDEGALEALKREGLEILEARQQAQLDAAVEDRDE